MSNFLRRWLPLFIWLGVIFYFSSRPDLPGYQIDWVDFAIKKTAHITEYAILAILAFRSFRRPLPDYSFLFSLFYAFTDETHQLFTAGRGAKLSDVLIDALGILIGTYLIKKRHVR